jgi:uncharacterized membrane protein YgcG
MEGHTIVLLQQSASEHSRTYYAFESRRAALEGILAFYEAGLRAAHPHASSLTYSAADVHTFIDRLGDVSMLVAGPDARYTPHSRQHVKDALFGMLKKQATAPQSGGGGGGRGGGGGGGGGGRRF